MAHKFALEAIVKEMNRLKLEKQRAIERFDRLISDCHTSIEVLSGKTVWETEAEMTFDDENPNYIKSSEEEI